MDLSFDDLIPKGRKPTLELTFDDLVSAPPTGGGAVSDIPEGMVLDPNTGSYTSRELMANTMRPSAAEAAITGGAMGASFGLADEMAGHLPNGEFYREKARAMLDAGRRDRPYTTGVSELAGGLTTGLGAGGAGLTVMRGGMSLPMTMGAGAIEGAGYGALAGAGYAEDGEKTRGALTGSVLGAGAGAATPAAIAGIGAGAKMAGGVLGIGGQSRANSAVAEALSRSGRSMDDVADDMMRAKSDGQGEYMLADALGNPGRRMLTGIVRSPGDARTKIVEALQRRQAGQSGRLVNALSEGFDAPDTALQRRSGLEALRQSQANTNYMLARDGAGAVDPTAAIGMADDFLQPGAARVMSPQSNIADDSIESAVRRARSYLTDGNSVVSDFDAALRSKMELDNMIDRAAPTVQRQLIPIRNALDEALEAASPNYATARNAYRQQSRAIEAVDTGTAAASGRMRSDDTIGRFSRMAPEEQAAFRAGYADPLIARVDSASISPTTNKARGLITGKTEREFPAFAAPGKADQLGDRIARENRMFETANAALGGSKTADNLADIADLQSFDPTMIGAVMSGNVKGALLHALTKSGNVLQGRNQQTRDLIARALMETDASKATQSLAEAVRRGEALSAAEKAIVRALAEKAGGYAPELNR